MDPGSGNYVRAFTPEEASEKLGVPADRLVMIHGTDDQVREISRKIKTANQAKARRDARKRQRNARRRNRP